MTVRGATLHIHDTTLIDGSGRDPVEHACVTVVDGRIAGVARGAPPSSDELVVDGSGLVLIPGLIDSHCHLGGASYPDEDMWVLEDDRYQAIASVAQAKRMLHHGVTSARDISVNGPHLKRAINAGIIEGPRLVPCWRGLSRTGGHGDGSLVSAEMVERSHPWGIVADGPIEVRKAVRRAIKNGAECIKVWASGGGLHENEPENVQHYQIDELRSIVEEAALSGIPVAAHCEGSAAARDAVEAGAWSIEHGEELNHETIGAMAARGTFLNPTLVLLHQWFELELEGGPYYTGRPPFIPGGGQLPTDTGSLRHLHRERLSANLRAARDAGVRIGVGSDSFATEMTPYGEQTLAEVHALVDAGLTEMEALVAATRTGAEMLRLDQETGTVEEGKAADLILLAKNPVDDIKNLTKANMVLILSQGRVVMASDSLGQHIGRV